MEIFISWSGDLSRSVAELLREWLPLVIQRLKPYVSTHDIAPGERWLANLHANLEQGNYGILCLTPDNLDAPWLLFEAGALSKHREESRLTSILLANLKYVQMSRPLNDFQYIEPTKDDMLKMMTDINDKLGDDKLGDTVLSTTFQTNWSRFESGYKQAIEAAGKEKEQPPLRSDTELLEELVQMARLNQRAIQMLHDVEVFTLRTKWPGYFRNLGSLADFLPSLPDNVNPNSQDDAPDD